MYRKKSSQTEVGRGTLWFMLLPYGGSYVYLKQYIQVARDLDVLTYVSWIFVRDIWTERVLAIFPWPLARSILLWAID